ncbi:hypothetical protein GCG54_00011273 [Colletotrichum gloeosporioides]|uniref:Uncharacterized protein n=1 Tax=Colletotrichum gloeosporioides TaxID=474922 RepID=A0A8H4CSE6_COLGL|nr:uncharacterized protein GCG54_00011273 [Colletotrichum gloeosporioides]KAF3809077.1 hypothetical protein GCG54_00011273 [Colletotrichum gloeosporioides]
MRFFLAFLLAALQISFASAGLRLKQCGTTFPTNWVSNCSPTDQQDCKTLCGQKLRDAPREERVEQGKRPILNRIVLTFDAVPNGRRATDGQRS